jgi:hypothetical protein
MNIKVWQISNPSAEANSKFRIGELDHSRLMKGVAVHTQGRVNAKKRAKGQLA